MFQSEVPFLLVYRELVCKVVYPRVFFAMFVLEESVSLVEGFGILSFYSLSP